VAAEMRAGGAYAHSALSAEVISWLQRPLCLAEFMDQKAARERHGPAQSNGMCLLEFVVH
jgi:hypothetical protein